MGKELVRSEARAYLKAEIKSPANRIVILFQKEVYFGRGLNEECCDGVGLNLIWSS